MKLLYNCNVVMNNRLKSDLVLHFQVVTTPASVAGKSATYFDKKMENKAETIADNK